MKTFKKTKVSIFGETYVLLSDESEEHINAVVQEVDDLMRIIASKSEISDSKKIAVLTAVQLASQLKALREQIASYSNKERELVDHIDRELLSL
jgi:cell division protein ZapA